MMKSKKDTHTQIKKASSDALKNTVRLEQNFILQIELVARGLSGETDDPSWDLN